MKHEANYVHSIPSPSLRPLQLVNWAMESMNSNQKFAATRVL